MREFIEITKALSDNNRVRILMALRKGELCVCQITELLELAPSTVSKHMSILDHARLVNFRKKGRWVYYRLASGEDSMIVYQALSWMRQSLENDQVFLQDSNRRDSILSETCAEKSFC